MIQTVLGPIEDAALGPALAHEHIVVDFHDPKQPPRAFGEDEVVAVLEPHLRRLREAGCAGFVDCTPAWLGRAPRVLHSLSQRTGLHIITNTGWYQHPMLPPMAYEWDERRIADTWIAEARSGIEGTGVRPGFIKIALNSGELTPISQKILQAALLAAGETGLTIVSHTVGRTAALQAAAVLDGGSFPLNRFVWAHADAEDGPGAQAGLARRGMWISLDGIGARHSAHVAMLRTLLDDGLQDHVLLSQDSGWYHVGEPLGGQVNPFHKLFTEFLPYAQGQGIPGAALRGILSGNVARMLAVAP